MLTIASKNRPKLLLWCGVALVLFIAIGKIFAVIAPPLVIWHVAHPRGSSGVSWFPKAFRLYITEIVKSTNLSEDKVQVLLFFTLIVSIVLVALGVLAALRRPFARVSIVGICAVLLACHAIGAATAPSASGVFHQIGWVLLHSAIVVIFTRKSILQLFKPPPCE